jgi:hypothetical protein
MRVGDFRQTLKSLSPARNALMARRGNSRDALTVFPRIKFVSKLPLWWKDLLG